MATKLVQHQRHEKLGPGDGRGYLLVASMQELTVNSIIGTRLPNESCRE